MTRINTFLRLACIWTPSDLILSGWLCIIRHSNSHKASVQQRQHLTEANGSVIGNTTCGNQSIWLVQHSSLFSWPAVNFLPQRAASQRNTSGPGAFTAAHNASASSCCSWDAHNAFMWTSCSDVRVCWKSYSTQENSLCYVLFMVCEQLNGESHKFIQCDVVTLVCVVTYLSWYQIIPFIKWAF